MASSSIPAKHEWRRAAETLSIAALGGITLNWLGFPAGLVTGSLLGVAAAALCGRPVHIPVPLSRVISVLVGISLGAVVTPDTLKGLAAFPLSVLVLAVSTLCMITATSSYLRYVAAGPPSIVELMILVAVCTAAALLFFKLRLPGGLMFGSMLASAVLHGG